MSAEHSQVSGWVGPAGECGGAGVECACGTIFDGFDTLAGAAEQLDQHIDDCSKRAEFVAGLRELADWYQAHPDAPMPHGPRFSLSIVRDTDEAGEQAIEALAIAMGVGVKRSRDVGIQRAERRFSGLRLEASYVPKSVMAQHYADQRLLKAAKAAQISAEIDPAVRERAEYTAGLRMLAAALDTIAPTARTGTAIPPTPVDPGSLQGGTGPGHQDAGDGQGTRPAGAGGVGSPPAPATRGHPCIDVPAGVRVLGDPDYGQTKRSS
jgi:hypothetical protein